MGSSEGSGVPPPHRPATTWARRKQPACHWHSWSFVGGRALFAIYYYILPLSLSLYIYSYILYLSFVYSILSSFSPLLPMPYPLFLPPPPIAYSLFTITYFLSLSLYIYLHFSTYRLFIRSFFLFAIIAYALFLIPYYSLPHLLPIPYLLLHTSSLSLSIYI